MSTKSSVLSKIHEYVEKENYSKSNDLIDELCKNKLTSYFSCKFCKEISKKGGELSKNFFGEKFFFTVITINFNNLIGLEKTINSVIGQSVRNKIQYVVVDGGSTDGSLEYIKKLESKIDIAIYGKDKGIYDAMNRGCEFINSEYTVFMNSGDCFDDFNVVDKIQQIILKQSVLPGAVYGKTRRETGDVWITHEVPDIWKGMICSHQSIFLRSINLINNPFDTSHKVVSDFEVIYKTFLKGQVFVDSNIVVAHIEDPGVSGDFKARTIERWEVVRENLPPNVTKEDVDEFYQTLLSNEEGKGGAHGHKPNRLHYELFGNIQERVIFLISMPRSGSTLLQRILEKSGQISSLGESWVMLPLASIYNDNLITAKYSQDLNIKAKDEFIQEIEDNEIILKAQRTYADTIYSNIVKKSKKKYFLDKTPRYIYIVDELQKIYPNAKFIVLLREPAAVISSYAHTWFKGSYSGVLNDQYCKYDITDGFDKLANFAQSDFKNKFTVRYEDLVSNPENIMQGLCNYLGVKFNEDIINYNSPDNVIKKYKFGDPGTVYKKNKPDPKNKDKWLDTVKTESNAEEFLSVLSLIPDNTFFKLGYNKKISTEKVIKKINNTFDLLTVEKAKVDFGDNSKILIPKRLTFPSVSSGGKSVGVLITCYNNKDTIVNAINSVLYQSRKPDLIVIADDCSTDDSIALIRESMKKHSSIQLIARTKNVGVSANRDLAIRKMDTDYISTLDGDDLFLQGKIELEFMALNGSNSKVAFSDTAVLSNDRSFVQKTEPYMAKSWSNILNMIASRSTPVPRDMMFPKNLYEKAGGFDVEMNIYEDWAFKMRLMLSAEEGGWVHSGGIGTVYDRRNPGLSNKVPVFHAYGQLAVIARNAANLKAFPESIILGLKTASKHLNGKLSDRMALFISKVEQEGLEQCNVINKLDFFWKNISFCDDDQIKFKAIWFFSSLEKRQ